MIMQTAKITRRSKVGFGYTSACENDERGNLKVCATTEPTNIGTVKQVLEMNNNDSTLKFFQSGTYYTCAWFVKIGRNWHKIIDNYSQSLSDLYLKDWHDELPESINIAYEFHL